MPTTMVASVPVLWEEPVAAGERRLVIVIPGFTGTKEMVHDHLRELAAAGYLALGIDPVDHGERTLTGSPDEGDPSNGMFRNPATGLLYHHFWQIVAETAHELPALIDWANATLQASGQVGICGISMGGNSALVAAALDQRIAAITPCMAEADWLRPGSSIPISVPNPAIQALYDRYNPLTHPEHYQHCPAMLLQCGADDQLVPPGGAQRFVEALSETYAGCPERLAIEIDPGVGHEFTPRMWQRSLEWFRRFLPV